jgi:hypothetical protein
MSRCYRKLFGLLLIAPMAVGCMAADGTDGEPGIGKDPSPAPFYGTEEEGKADTARKPASTEPIAFGIVKTATFTPTEQFRAFTFSGAAGQLVDLYADGLDGLDTVLYLFRVSPQTGRPFGWPIAWNDDASDAGWMVGSNPEPNRWSSHVASFTLPELGSYALVVTTYWQLYDGAAEVVVKTPEATGQTCGGFANLSCPEGQVCAFQPYTCIIPDMAGSCMVPLGSTGFHCAPPNPNVDNRVCGCDGQSYVDACHARMLGASIAADGPCATP